MLNPVFTEYSKGNEEIKITVCDDASHKQFMSYGSGWGLSVEAGLECVTNESVFICMFLQSLAVLHESV